MADRTLIAQVFLRISRIATATDGDQNTLKASTRRIICTFVRIPAQLALYREQRIAPHANCLCCDLTSSTSSTHVTCLAAPPDDSELSSWSKIVETSQSPFFPVSKCVTIMGSHEFEGRLCLPAATDSAMECSLSCPRLLFVNLLNCPGTKWLMPYYAAGH